MLFFYFLLNKSRNLKFLFFYLWFGCQNPFCAIMLQYTVLDYVYIKENHQYTVSRLSKKGFDTQTIYGSDVKTLFARLCGNIQYLIMCILNKVIKILYPD